MIFLDEMKRATDPHRDKNLREMPLFKRSF